MVDNSNTNTREDSSNQNSSRYNAKNIAKTVGRGALIGGAAAIGAGAYIGGKAIDGTRKFTSDVKELSNFSEGTGLVLLFLASLIIHIVDAWSGWFRPGWVLYAYVVLIVYAFFFLFNMRMSSDEGVFIAVALLSYFLPILIRYIEKTNSAGWLLAITGIIIALPLLPLYIGLKFSDHTLIGKISKWYVIFWVLMLLFYLLNTFTAGQTNVAQGRNVYSGFTYMQSFVSKTWNTAATNIGNSIDRATALATGRPYEGQEESRVGIYLENVKPLESRYNTYSNVVVEAKVKAVNIKERMNVTTFCYIDGITAGTMSPAILTDVESNYENIVTCSFGTGKLPEGTYTAKVMVLFNFESSSDVEYTFVDSNVKSDQYNKLGISPTTIATYTGGPVELGLPSLTQPLKVNTNAGVDSAELSTYPFGVSLKNKWVQGKITKGLMYTLNVPSEVTLIDCNRKYRGGRLSNGRDEYIFEIDTTQAQDYFDAVSCRMKFNNVNMLLGGNIKNTKTFAAKAKYEYSIEASTPIIIEKG